MSKITPLGADQSQAPEEPVLMVESQSAAPLTPVDVAPAPISPEAIAPSAVQGRSPSKSFFDEDKQADTKTFFDSLRNMGICIAMLLGLPAFYKATEYLPHGLQTSAGCFVIGAVIVLASANILWTLQVLKEKSSMWAKGLFVILELGITVIFVVSAFRSLPGF